MNSTIDFVLAYSGTAAQQQLLHQLEDNSAVRNIVLVSLDGIHLYNSPKVVNVQSDSLCGSKLLRQISQVLSSKWCVCFLSLHRLDLSYRCLERMMQVATDVHAGMLYCDRFDADGKHPVIDWVDGSLRDDFDFGSLWMFRSDLLQSYMSQNASRYRYAGIYAFRLFISRKGRIFHLPESLYTEFEEDLRQSGVKQFDYVNPTNRAVQKEMERACTEHLKQIGACLHADEFDNLPHDDGEYPVEVSVIIPVRNRVRTIADAVKSALSQETSFLFNVIVVDNHSDDGTAEKLSAFDADQRVIVISPERDDLGIGGCWDLAVRHDSCGRYVVQLDSDDLYSGTDVLEQIVNVFRKEKAAMVIGAYRMVDFDLQTLPPGLITHDEWTKQNGRNNALRINGLGAPRAFRTAVLRRIGFPNTSYGEDYAVGLRISRSYPIARIFDELYLCRRWDGNSDSNLSIQKMNENNAYKDRIRTIELHARQALIRRWNNPVDEQQIDAFFKKQLQGWGEVKERFENLKGKVLLKQLPAESSNLAVQHNPMRKASTNAKIDKEHLKSRPCFLCDENRPLEQVSLPVLGHYQILVNPYPILPGHLTITTRKHQPQRFACFSEVLDSFVWNMPHHVVFYNGPRCGASAPDHAHLQAGARGIVPIERDWSFHENHLERLYPSTHEEEIELEEMGYSNQNAGIFLLKGYACPAFVIRGIKAEAGPVLMRKLLSVMPCGKDQEEPDFNLLAWRQEGANGVMPDHIVYVVFARSKHRPDCYYAENEGHCMVSPGALDMGGLLVTPRQVDFENMTSDKAVSILSEVCLSQSSIERISHKMHLPRKSKHLRDKGDSFLGQISVEPFVSVGILSGNQLDFELHGHFLAKGNQTEGLQHVSYSEGAIMWNGNVYSELQFSPLSEDATFTLKNVMIGKNFHWQRNQDQTFHGSLRIIVDEGMLVAINDVKVETYLASVISSEMNASSSLGLLKAHAVVSRSWLLSQMRNRQENRKSKETHGFFSFAHKPGELIRWYDRNDHALFDVCADDHCQRYQGLTSGLLDNVLEAVHDTRGEVLLYEGELCDARFSKCCGGVTERYGACWEPKDYPYLKPVRDFGVEAELPNLADESKARDWILQSPMAYCNTSSQTLLRQVLNSYDQETQDFYRWKVTVSQADLVSLLKIKLGLDFGNIKKLKPVERAASGRLVKLKIIGTKLEMTIGKELEIRRVLSPTHLYSSAIVIDSGALDEDGFPIDFTIHGAGWGHGVGLCQIGAAVMADEGFSYADILRHYYQGATLEKLYE